MDIFNYFRSLLCCITFTLIASNSYSNTANPTWDYQVTTDKSKNSINVTAKKVSSLIKNTYRVKVVPSSVMVGRTVMNRLFSRNVAAFATVASIDLLLKSLDFKIDYDTQTIYREITEDSGIGWLATDGKWYVNPEDWGKAWVQRYNENGASPIAVFNRVELDEHDKAYLYVDRTYGTETYTTSITVAAPTTNPNVRPIVTQVMTPEALGDMVLGNPANPNRYSPSSPVPTYPEQYSPDLPNIYQPVPDITYSHSDPTVTEVARSLEQAIPTSNSSEITHTNPQTGEQSNSVMPVFCDWATPVCNFIDWFTDDSAIPEPEQHTISEFNKSRLPTDPQFNFNGQCPAPKTFTLNLGLASTEISLPYDYFCSFAIDVRAFVILAAWLHACYIFAGYVRS